VYRSDAASPSPVLTSPPASAVAVPVAHASAVARRAPAVDRFPSAIRVVDWMTLPFQIAVMVALVPFRSK